MRNDSKKAVAVYIRFGRAESDNPNSRKYAPIDWIQMWADYRKKQAKYSLSKI